MKVRLFEIFTSIEGEGLLLGTKTLFVRLAGCPFGCFYCDTPLALPLDSGQEYSIEECIKLVDKNLQDNTYKVNFTGGDPLIQYEAVAELAKFVKSKNIKTYLESSCFDFVKFNHVLPFIDFVKIEFKTIESGFVEPKHYETLLKNEINCLKESINQHKLTYIKIVVSSKTTIPEFSRLIKTIFGQIIKSGISGFVIQPTSGIAEPDLKLLLSLYDIVYPHYPEVRIVPQLHKVIGAP